MSSNALHSALIQTGIINSTGCTTFTLNSLSMDVLTTKIVGDLIGEWVGKFMDENYIPYKPNPHQSEPPDFYMNPKDFTRDWLEVKCFTGRPNFDIGNFFAYVDGITANPHRLDASYLIFQYSQQGSIITIENLWLKKIWEITCPSDKAPLKLQWKRGYPYNIRPATWYSLRDVSFDTFGSLNDFLNALDETLWQTMEFRPHSDTWLQDLKNNYVSITGNQI